MPTISKRRAKMREILKRNAARDLHRTTVRKVLSDVERVDERAEEVRREIAEGARPNKGRFKL
jgi:hypothetical protein